ncbi:hypothetical protein WJX84_010949 [Apatococcus fuscideae]|uniref:Uncharacterized protein n=1 Tax=Apatococcus fuscideae TaxID=2026836 RepID=A0AAW1SUC6_9CHLO
MLSRPRLRSINPAGNKTDRILQRKVPSRTQRTCQSGTAVRATPLIQASWREYSILERLEKAIGKPLRLRQSFSYERPRTLAISALQLVLGHRQVLEPSQDCHLIIRQVFEMMDQNADLWKLEEVQALAAIMQELLRWEGMDWLQAAAEKLAQDWEDDWMFKLERPSQRMRLDSVAELPAVACSLLKLVAPGTSSAYIQASVMGLGRAAESSVPECCHDLTPQHLAMMLQDLAALSCLGAWSHAASGSKASGLSELTDCLAREAMGSLASRNSAQARFDPSSLVGLLRGIRNMALGVWAAGTKEALLDKAASYIVHRIQLRHLIAVNRTDDIVAILGVYAALQHRSLGTEDLLAAFALQACRSCAAGAEMRAANMGVPPQAGWRFSQAQIASFLMSYVRLRYHPGDQVLMALTAQYVSAGANPSIQPAPPMLEALSHLNYNPGHERYHAAGSELQVIPPRDREYMHLGWWALCQGAALAPQHANSLAVLLGITKLPAEQVWKGLRDAMDIQLEISSSQT